MLKCKTCPYFDTIPEKMKWGLCKKDTAFRDMRNIVRGPDMVCTKHWDKEEKPIERNV